MRHLPLLAVFMALAGQILLFGPAGGADRFGGLLASPAAQAVVSAAPMASLRFAVIGDNGTGDAPEYDIGRQMAAFHATFAFDLVLMLGDNMYGRQAAADDFVDKFEHPYKPLLDAGVRFYAALGNHDAEANRLYPGFNMGGLRYYTFVRGNVRFVALDTNVLDATQLAWADDVLSASPEAWKIVYFHHPLYSDGARHGSNVELRVRLEPLLVKHAVTAVFSGHDHLYERIKPQKGITYFVEGASGKLRHGVDESGLKAAAFDQDQSFMLVEIDGDELRFRAVSRTGALVDSGVVPRRPGT